MDSKQTEWALAIKKDLPPELVGFLGVRPEHAETPTMLELVEFIRIYRSCQHIAIQAIENPAKAELPLTPPAGFAVVAELATKVTPENFVNILIYGDRLPMDFTILLLKMCLSKSENLTRTPEFVNWCCKKKDEIL